MHSRMNSRSRERTAIFSSAERGFLKFRSSISSVRGPVYPASVRACMIVAMSGFESSGRCRVFPSLRLMCTFASRSWQISIYRSGSSSDPASACETSSVKKSHGSSSSTCRTRSGVQKSELTAGSIFSMQIFRELCVAASRRVDR